VKLLLFFSLCYTWKWNGETRYTLFFSHLIYFVRNTKLSAIFVRPEDTCAATAAKLFWDVKQRRWVISYRLFGTTYWMHLPPFKIKPTGHPTMSVTNYEPTQRNTQHSEDLIYTAAKAWNLVYLQSCFMVISVLWDVRPYSWLHRCQRFEGTPACIFTWLSNLMVFIMQQIVLLLLRLRKTVLRSLYRIL
jgi:hypothetical protein